MDKEPDVQERLTYAAAYEWIFACTEALFNRLKMCPDDIGPELRDSVAKILLAPHKSYYRFVEPLLDAGVIRGLAHITGGEIRDNLPRILPPGTGAEISLGSWPILPIFSFIQAKRGIADEEMFRTFNMGIGLILVVTPENAPDVKQHLASFDEPCYDIGSIVAGDGVVRYS